MNLSGFAGAALLVFVWVAGIITGACVTVTVLAQSARHNGPWRGER